MPRKECRTHPHFQDIWGEELRKPLAYFPNTHSNKVKICSETYHCVRQGENNIWKKNLSRDDVLSADACKTDALYAMAYQNGCLASFRNANEKCKRVEACLSKPNDDKLYCVSKTSRGIPDVFPADLTCNATVPDPKIHEIVKETEYAGAQIVTLRNKDREDSDTSDDEDDKDKDSDKSMGLVQTMAQRVESAAESAAENIADGIMEESQSQNDVNISSGNVVGKIPKALRRAKENILALPEASVKPQYTHPHYNLSRCDLKFAVSKSACSVNTDCLNDDSAFEAWWSNTAKNVKKGQRVRDLLEQERDEQYEEVDFTFTSDHVKLEHLPLQKREMKSAVRAMYESDPVLKASIYNVLKNETDFEGVVENRKDMCVSGKCKGPSITPRLTLFDGTEDAMFQRDADDNIYISSKAFPLRKIVSKYCNPKDEDGWDDACMDPNASYDIQGQKLKAFESAKAPTYKVTFPDEKQYLVQNTLMVESNAPDAKAQCARHICSIQSVNKCPSAYCAVDGNKCVPKANMQESIILRQIKHEVDP